MARHKNRRGIGVKKGVLTSRWPRVGWRVEKKLKKKVSEWIWDLPIFSGATADWNNQTGE